MIKILFSTRFRKLYKKADRKVQKCCDNRMVMFENNPDNPTLNNHVLTGKLQGLRSININGDWRAIYSIAGLEEVVFLLLGTHSQLYK